MQSKTAKDSITLYGEVYATVEGNRQPVMIAMILSPQGKSGKILNLEKISSAYVRGAEDGKGSSEFIKAKAQDLIDSSDILYVDPNKKRTDNWLGALGLQLPSGLTKYGSIGRVTYYADVVKNQDKEFGRGAFAEAFKKAGIETSKKQFSLSKEHSDDLPIRSDIYGKDIALDIPIRDDIAPVQEDVVKQEYDKAEDKTLYQYIVDALSGKTTAKSYHKISSKISERLAADIKKIVGFSVENYGNEISTGNIEHIQKDHGINGDSDSSMSNLHDLAKIGYVIENYDKIREGKISRQYRNRDGSLAKTVELQKKIGDDFYYVVEAVPDAKLQTLHVVSAYKNKNDTFIEKAVPDGPSRYVQDESQSDESFSNNIVSQTSKNATDFDDLPIRDDLKQSSNKNVWDMSEESWEEYMKQGEEELTKDLSPAQKEKFTRKKLHQKIMDNIKARFQEKGFNFELNNPPKMVHRSTSACTKNGNMGRK